MDHREVVEFVRKVEEGDKITAYGVDVPVTVINTTVVDTFEDNNKVNATIDAEVKGYPEQGSGISVHVFTSDDQTTITISVGPIDDDLEHTDQIRWADYDDVKESHPRLKNLEIVD